MEYETRVFVVRDLEVRQATEDEPPVIVGYPAVYDAVSEDLGGFREMIEPGFFDGVIDSDDTRAVQNHDPNLVLGRRKAGTLIMDDTPRGLRTLIMPPDTQYARDLLTVMARGDVDQMSFMFATKPGEAGARWEKTEDGTPLRILRRGGCERLLDVSVVTYPAYPQTSAQARSEARALIEDDTLTDGARG
jgi:HK97 family phage prohead protease